MSVDPAEAGSIRTAVGQLIAGRSLNSVTLEWQDKGVLTPRGNLWTATVLRKTLGNPRLCAWRMINGELVRDAGGQPIVGQWEPILTTDE